MPEYPLANRIHDTLTNLAACLCVQLEQNDLPPTCFCGVIAGAMPYDATGVGDGCSDDDGLLLAEPQGCGQAWVRLVTSYPASAVGVADVTPGNCNKGIGIDVEIGVLRCIRIEENGGALPAEEMAEAVRLQTADMVTMMQALNCCDAVESENLVMGQYIPVGPDGGLVGGTWPVSILVM